MFRCLTWLLFSLGMTLGNCTSAAPAATAPTASTPTAATPDPVQLGGTWVVQSLRGHAVPAGTDAPAAPHLVFDAAQGRVTGSTGCNRLFGPYTATGTRLRLGPLSTTRMACPAPNPEPELLAALSAPDLSYRLGLDELTLLQGTTVLVVLRQAKP